MGGLLDFMNSDDARLGMGLLAAGGPQTDPTKTGLGAAFQSAQASMDAWKKQQVAQQLAQAQTLDAFSQAQERTGKSAIAQRQQAFLANPYNPDGSFNTQGATLAGIDPEKQMQFANLKNAGLSKAGTPVEIAIEGRPYIQMQDEYGRPLGAPQPKYQAPITIKQGDRETIWSPTTGNTVAQFGVNQSPDSAASVGATERGQDMTRGNLVWENQFKEAAKADQQKNGPLNDVQSKSLLFGSQIQQANNVLDSLNDVKSVPGADGKYTGAVRNMLTGDDQQKLSQAKRSFAGALLRRESGAAIAQKEYDDVDQRYFPQVGDSPAVIEQKRQARLLAQEGIKAEVPNYDDRISGINERIAAIPPAKSSQPGGAAAPKMAANAPAPAIAQLPAPAGGQAGKMTKQVTAPDGTKVAATRAPDGNYYVPDPNNPGKWARVKE